MASKPLKPHQQALIVAGIVAVLIWAIPVVQQAMLPLMYLNTHLHEFCHAITALAVGGHVQEIQVFSNGSGVTPVSAPGGLSVLFIASAGYVGAAILGALMIFFGRTAAGARGVLYTMGGILAFSMLLWVRGDTVGVLTGIFWVAALFGGARFLQGSALIFAAQFLGLQQCLNAFQSIYTLLNISAFSNSHSDAMLMQNASHVPALIWAVAWSLFSLVVVGLTLKAAWHQPTRQAG